MYTKTIIAKYTQIPVTPLIIRELQKCDSLFFMRFWG